MFGKLVKRLSDDYGRYYKYLGIFASFLLVAFSAVWIYSPVQTTVGANEQEIVNAAYSMSVSGSGVVNIDMVPTDVQQVFWNSQQVFFNTTCPYGVAVRLNNTSSTNGALVRTDTDESLKEIPATTGSQLLNNSWGYSINEGLNWYGVPLNGQEPATVYISSAAENRAIDVRFGVKGNIEIPSGTYSTELIYSLTPSANCLSYNLVFDSDGGTSFASKRMVYGETIDLASYVPEKAGVTFVGWEKVGTSTVYSTTEGPINVNESNLPEITLKAKYKKTIHTITTLQDIGPTLCLNTTTPNVTATELDWTGEHFGDPNYVPRTVMEDTRDGKKYLVSKLADGNCWMSQNLEFDLSPEVTLTNEDTDLVLKDSWTPTRATQTAANVSWPATPNGVDYSYHPIASDSYYRAGKNKSSSPTEVTERGDYNWESAGNYYNWVAATAGNGPSQTMNDSICPKGWRLPSSTGSRSYYDLINNVYGLTSSAANATKLRADPFNFVLNGYYRTASTSGMVSQGSIGGIWSTTPVVNNTANAYQFYITTSSFNTQNANSKGLGYSIRCVTPSRFLIRFVDTDGNLFEEIETNEGEHIDLTLHAQSKDGYKFRRWHVAGTDRYYTGNETDVDVNPERTVITVLQAEWWQTVWEFDYTPAPQPFTAPYNGDYKLEVWGAQGESQGGAGGYGAYATGEYEMTKDGNLYVYTGGTGLDSQSNHYPGWNGGGNCWGHMSGDDNYNWGLIYPTGGGGTDIRTTQNTTYSDRLLVAGGGGGAHAADGGASYGYGGGVGSKGPGGILGYRSTGVTGSYLNNPSGAVGGQCGNVWGTCANNDQSKCNLYNYHAYSTAAGGGGYEGGRSTQTNNLQAYTSGWNAYNIVGEGGSSYVGGVQNGQAIAGNAAMPVHRQMPGLSAGQETIVGNRTHGHARITYVDIQFE